MSDSITSPSSQGKRRRSISESHDIQQDSAKALRFSPSTSHSHPQQHHGHQQQPTQHQSFPRSIPNGPSPATNPPRTLPQHDRVDYVSRTSPQDLPLVDHENDALSYLTDLLYSYHEIIDRGESLASNLGAKLVSANLFKKIERMFDGPPRLVSSPHHLPKPTVTWLDIVRYAAQHPSSFSNASAGPAPNFNGVEEERMCDLHLPSGVHVQISEDDRQLIASGHLSAMIPLHNSIEDEEKELGTLEILESRVLTVQRFADQIAMHARQFIHALGRRRDGIVARRSYNGNDTNIDPSIAGANSTTPSSTSARHPEKASEATISELSHQFRTQSEQRNLTLNQNRHSFSANSNNTPISNTHYLTTGSSQIPIASSAPQFKVSTTPHPASPTTAFKWYPPRHSIDHHQSHFPQVLSTPRSELPPSTPTSASAAAAAAAAAKARTQTQTPGLQDSNPLKPLIIARLESLPKGATVYPPCDRCRRLGIACVKNLTACVGCTRKHAKCGWRNVREEEMLDPPEPGQRRPSDSRVGGPNNTNASSMASGGVSGLENHNSTKSNTGHLTTTDEEEAGRLLREQLSRSIAWDASSPEKQPDEPHDSGSAFSAPAASMIASLDAANHGAENEHSSLSGMSGRQSGNLQGDSIKGENTIVHNSATAPLAGAQDPLASHSNTTSSSAVQQEESGARGTSGR